MFHSHSLQTPSDGFPPETHKGNGQSHPVSPGPQGRRGPAVARFGLSPDCLWPRKRSGWPGGGGGASAWPEVPARKGWSAFMAGAGSAEPPAHREGPLGGRLGGPAAGRRLRWSTLRRGRDSSGCASGFRGPSPGFLQVMQFGAEWSRLPRCSPIASAPWNSRLAGQPSVLCCTAVSSWLNLTASSNVT